MKLTSEDILYEDREIIVCRKRAGIATQTSRPGEADMESILKNYLKTPYVWVVHRLDQPVEGILVFAKTGDAAAKLSAQNAGHAMNKNYYAVVMPSETGKLGKLGREYTLVDYLLKNGKENVTRVVGKGMPQAKRAELSYQIIKTQTIKTQSIKPQTTKTEQEERGVQTALLKVALQTGRHHQIRVQLSHAGLPILGDNKYGSGASECFSRERQIRNVALCAYHLGFFHPAEGKGLSFEIEPSGIAFRPFFPPDASYRDY